MVSTVCVPTRERGNEIRTGADGRAGAAAKKISPRARYFGVSGG